MHRELLLKNIQNVQGTSTNNANAETWKELNFNDSNWPKMQLPNLWEQQGLSNLDGIVWFRKTFNLPAADAGKTAQISLAMIDERGKNWQYYWLQY